MYLADYYSGDVPRIKVVEMLVHWSAIESMWKAKLKYEAFIEAGLVTNVTMERFDRHFKMWGELHGWST